MKKNDVYFGNFENWKDVVNSFNGTEYSSKEVPDIPEPEKVLFAYYDIDGYEGSACVMWKQGKKYYLLTGSHCSCYGLEECGWEPEEFESKELFVQFIEKASSYYIPEEHKDNILAKLKKKKATK